MLTLAFTRPRALLLGSASVLALLACQPAQAQRVSALGVSAGGGAKPASGMPGGVPAPAALPNALQRANALRARAASAADLAAQAQRLARAANVRTLTGPTLNGLGLGALDFGGRVRTTKGEPTDERTWQGASLPGQATAADGTITVTIKQDEAKAILNWDTFNIGSKTTLVFDQSAGNTKAAPKGAQEWIALNRVHDASARPSEILGAIKAEGQVYIVNRNGILFGGASQVNVHSLAASSLRLTDKQFLQGINTEVIVRAGAQYTVVAPTFGEHGEAAQSDKLAADQTIPAFDPGTAPGDVVFERGARIDAARGGKILAFGPHVINDGRISAMEGQVVLAAGEQVWLKSSVTSYQQSDEKSVRGFDVAVGAPSRWMFSAEEYMAGIRGGPHFPSYIFAQSVPDLLPEMAARATAVDYRVVNNGTVLSEFGDITLQARAIDQKGVLEATTGLNNRDGSIRLQGVDLGMVAYSLDYDPRLVPMIAGKVTLGAGSITAISPDLRDTSELEGEAIKTRYTPGRIELRGQHIKVGEGANVMAPAGDISIRAATNPQMPVQQPGGLLDGSTIDIGRDAFISVGGLQDIAAAMDRNIVVADLRINELRDSPLYRDSFLRGRSVLVDRRVSGSFDSGPMAGVKWLGESRPGDWIGTPIADVSQWIGVGRTDLAELSTAGGKIFLNTGGSLITRTGSMLDIGGGSLRYKDGYVLTSRLIGADGGVYDIGNADPNRLYIGMAEGFQNVHKRWGVIDTWTTMLSGRGRFERGYVEGQKGGSLQMYAGAAVVLDGDTWGGVITGDRQVSRPAQGGVWQFGDSTNSTRPYLFDHLIIGNKGPKLADDDSNLGLFFDKDADPLARKTTYLSAESLSNSGLGTINFNFSTQLDVEEGATVALTPGATFTLNASSGEDTYSIVNIDGAIKAAGGALTIAGRGLDIINLGGRSRLDLSGDFVNQALDGISASPLVMNGGAMMLSAGDGITAKAGAILDISGGGLVTQKGDRFAFTAGDAGSIQFTGITSEGLQGLDMRAYAAGSGGKLNVTTDADIVSGADAADAEGKFVLPANLYADRGFSTVGIGTTGDVKLGAGTDIRQTVRSIDMQKADFAVAKSGASLLEIGRLGELTLQERGARAPSSLTLSGVNVTLDAKASVGADIRGSVLLGGSGNVTLAGTIDAPAGQVTVSAGNLLTLASTARLSARGAPVIYDDGFGNKTGYVLPGGAVSLSSTKSLALEAGAVVDVSGSSGTVQVPVGTGVIPQMKDVLLASNGGSITISGGGLIASTFLAKAGGAGAIGGSLAFGVESTAQRSPRAQLLRELRTLTESCTVDGICSADKVAGTDFRYFFDLFYSPTYLEDTYGYTGPLLITADLVNALPNGIGGDLTISNSATVSGGTVDLAAFGVSEAMKTIFANEFGVDLAGIADSAGEVKSLVVRPAAFDKGGFADLSLQASGPITLDKVNLALGGRVRINGAVRSNGTDAGISARHISLIGNSAAATTLAGDLTLKADLIDINDTSIRGYAKTTLEGADIRFNRGNSGRDSSFAVDGALVLRAGQISPGTGARATITAADSILIERNGDAATTLAAVGSLQFEAPEIDQNGVVRAPFGTISFVASERLTLGAGSITSVTGDGLNLPYGTLLNGEQWFEPDLGVGVPTELLGPPDKRISLTAPTVDVQKDAVIDVRGGGDLAAREFVPGPGGSHDILGMSGMFAILPDKALSLAPDIVDGAGQRIWLAGGKGLAEGWYTLLPSQYAAMPGAYAVSLATSIVTGDTTTSKLPDGSLLMNGRLGNGLTGETDAQTSTWRIYSGDVIRKYSEYNEAFGNSFFSSEAFRKTQYRTTGKTVVTPRLARDGGSVQFSATDRLIFDGELRSQAAKDGSGGLIDISATRIAVLADVNAVNPDIDGYLRLDAKTLSGFGAGSLLLGGVRSGDRRGLRLDVTATDVLIANSEATSLTGAEVILAARDTLTVAAGASIRAVGTIDTSSADLVLTEAGAGDQGALLRVSNGSQVRVLRDEVNSAAGGFVTIGAGARIDGGKALLIDATGDTFVDGARLSGDSLSLASGRVAFGGTGTGLIIDETTLAQLAATRNLTLRSYSSIDFFRGVDLSSFESVSLDAAALVGRNGQSVSLSGKRILLENSGGVFTETGIAPGGALTLRGDEVVLGLGTKEIAGFAALDIIAAKAVLAQGSGLLVAGNAAVTLTAPQITGSGGADQAVRTTGALRIAGSGTAPAASVDSLGTRLSFTAGSIDVSGRINALGGSVALASTGGDVTLGDGAVIEAGGFAKRFFDVEEYADAGAIRLSAAGSGSILVGQGARLGLAGGTGGGGAGTLSISTSAGAVSLAGTIDAKAATGERGGAFTLQVDELPNFAQLNDRLNIGGFSYSRQFRIRAGDVTVDGVTDVADFGLIADAGTVTVSGTINARQTYGGRISISAGDGVAFTNSARLVAGATDATLGSGRVTIEASGGVLNLAGGTIDVGGGEGGRVRFRALRDSTNSDVAVTALGTGIVGARSAVLEAVRVYQNGSVDAVRGQAISDADAFAGNAGAVAARLGRSDVAVMAGIEIRSAGDLTLGSDWNLASMGQHEGGLTLRAAGNLLINGNLSDGFSAADRSGLLLDADSWDIRLVAGADMSSASALSLQLADALPTGSGSVLIGDANNGFVVRTGTGDLSVAAGRDLRLGHVKSAVYTAGRLDTTPLPGFINGPQWRVRGDGSDPWFPQPELYQGRPAEFAKLGGHLDIRAQGDVVSKKAGNEGTFFSDWLIRQAYVDASGVFVPRTYQLSFIQPPVTKGPQQSAWWVDYSQFQHGLGALGGGNLSLDAGGDVVDVLAALASNGRVTGGLTLGQERTLVLGNGGLMNITATGAIRGGQYLAGRGRGEINAGEFATGRAITVRDDGGSRPDQVLALAPVLALGDTQVRVRTAGDLVLQTVVDPLMAKMASGVISSSNAFSEYGLAMFGYTDRTALNLVSVGGDITLVNQGQYLARDVTVRGDGLPINPDIFLADVGASANRYPMLFRATALNGDFLNDGHFNTVTGLPVAAAADRAQSELRILAAGDIELGTFTLSRATSAAISTPLMPNGSPRYEEMFRNENYYSGVLLGGNPETLPLANDFTPSRIYALDGNISTGGNRNKLQQSLSDPDAVRMNEATWIRAGNDIRNIRYFLRNIRPTDVSIVEAGNDIIAGSGLQDRGREFEIMGPGALTLSAGRDIYGGDLDIWSYGNRRFDSNNRVIPGTDVFGLPEDGAEITMIAGLNGALPGYDRFVSSYLDPANLATMPDYLKERGTDGVLRPIYFTDRLEKRAGVPDKVVRTGLVSFMKGITGEALTPETAWTQFQALAPEVRQRFVRDVYMQELRSAGQDQLFKNDAGVPRNGGYNRGYAAIKSLFPGDEWKGDLRFSNALIRTMAGGNIQMIAPGGGLQVANLNSVADAGRGFVTLGSGQISVMTKNDVVVNRSRLLTFAGGDEIVWSTLGDIDAGRGAKTTRVPNAPEILYDAEGNVEIRERADISGSGIGTIRGFTDVEPGDVTLIAPGGTVNAGDAGIRVSGNLYIAALQVLNAGNIDVKGEAFGIPVVKAVDVGLNLSSASVAGAAAQAAEAVQGTRQSRPTTITVTIDGFGLEGSECDPVADSGCRR